jgi:hypothetical protein
MLTYADRMLTYDSDAEDARGAETAARNSRMRELRYSVYLLYWYKRKYSDAAAAYIRIHVYIS